jgi:hypothetical protein
MGNDAENKTGLTLYRPDQLYSSVNKKQTLFSIFLKSNHFMLFQGTSLYAAEAWLSRHLLPTAMPKSKLSSAIADAFHPRK